MNRRFLYAPEVAIGASMGLALWLILHFSIVTPVQIPISQRYSLALALFATLWIIFLSILAIYIGMKRRKSDGNET